MGLSREIGVKDPVPGPGHSSLGMQGVPGEGQCAVLYLGLLR